MYFTFLNVGRPAFMLELRKTCAALVAIQPRLSEVHEQQSALVTSAEQRLKWGAGANPALSEVRTTLLPLIIILNYNK